MNQSNIDSHPGSSLFSQDQEIICESLHVTSYFYFKLQNHQIEICTVWFRFRFCPMVLQKSHYTKNPTSYFYLSVTEYVQWKCISLTSLTRAKCSTLCWKILNISGSVELFAL